MSESREMNVNAALSPKACGKCGQVKMTISGVVQCPNCSTENEPKTGHTIIVTEPTGERGPAHVKFLAPKDAFIMEAEQVLAERKKAAVLAGVAEAKATSEGVVATPAGTVVVHVPVSLFPDLVMWARKQKIPRDWKQAEKIKAITDFQIEINLKLGGLK